MKIGIGVITFSSPTFSKFFFLLLPARLWLLGQLLQKNPEQPSLLLSILSCPEGHPSTRAAVVRGALQCAPKNSPTQLNSEFEGSCSSTKSENIVGNNLGQPYRALRLCFLGIRAALSGQAVQLSTEHPSSAAAPSRDSLEQTPPVASPAVLPPLQGGHWQEQHPFLEISISIC